MKQKINVFIIICCTFLIFFYLSTQHHYKVPAKHPLFYVSIYKFIDKKDPIGLSSLGIGKTSLLHLSVTSLSHALEKCRFFVSTNTSQTYYLEVKLNFQTFRFTVENFQTFVENPHLKKCFRIQIESPSFPSWKEMTFVHPHDYELILQIQNNVAYE